MAYRSYGRGGRRSSSRSRSGYSTRRRTTSPRTRRSRGNSGGVMRLVIEHVTASPVSRSLNPVGIPKKGPSKAKL